MKRPRALLLITRPDYGGGLPTIWQEAMRERSRPLRFAQPKATLRDLLRSAMLDLVSSISNGWSGACGIEHRLVGKHFTGDRNQAVGDGSQRAPMSVASGA